MKLLKTNLTIRTLLLAIVAINLFSCSSTPDSMAAIPSETNMVTVIDMFSLYRKGNLKDMKDFSFFKTFRKELRNEDKKIARYMDELMEDPRKTGIDFTQDVFMYYLNASRDETYFCMAMDVSNADKFESFIDDILNKAKIDYDLEKEDAYNYIIIQRETAIAWDDNKAVMLVADNRKSRENLDLQIETLFELKDNKRLSSNKSFNTFYKNKKDVSFWVSSNMVENMYQFRQIQREIDFDITDNYMALHLNFDDEDIVLNTTIYPNEELTKLMDKHDVWDNTFNAKLLKYLPEETYANGSMSLNPSKYYEFMTDQEDLDKIENEFQKEMGFELEDFMDSFEGNVVMSLIGFEEEEFTYEDYRRVYYDGGFEYKDTLVTETSTIPVMGLVFDVNTDKYLKKLLNKIPENEYEKRNGYYQFKFDNIYPAYFAFNDDLCLLTNHKKAIKAFKDGGLESSTLADADNASNFSKSGYYAYMNLNYDDYPKELKTLFKDIQNSKEEEVFATWNKFPKSFEIKMIDTNSMEFTVTTNSDGKNSLNLFLELMDEAFENYSSF